MRLQRRSAVSMATGLASGHRAPILLIASLSAALIVIHVALFGDAARRVMFPARVFDERRDALILPRNRTEARFDRVWMESTGPNSGLVHVRFDKSCLSDVGHPVLRIRVMGPQILLLDAKPTSDPAYWIAPYTIECIGRYTIEVMPLFTDFVEEDIKHGQIIAQWPPFFDLHVPAVIAHRWQSPFADTTRRNSLSAWRRPIVP